MPVTLKPVMMKVKDSDGQYVGVDAIAQETTEDQLAAITAEGTAQVGRVEDVGDDQVDRIDAKAAEVESSLPTVGEMEGMLAPAFSSSAAYKAGDYVIHADSNDANHVYRFVTDHAAGEWTGNDAVQVSIGEEASQLKNAVYATPVYAASAASEWERGAFQSSTGVTTSATDRIRTKSVGLPQDVREAIATEGYKFYAYAWSGSTYLGVWDQAASSFFIGSATGKTVTAVNLVSLRNAGATKIRLVLMHSDGTLPIDPADGVNVVYTFQDNRIEVLESDVDGLESNASELKNALEAIKPFVCNSVKASKNLLWISPEFIGNNRNGLVITRSEDGESYIVNGTATDATYVRLNRGYYADVQTGSGLKTGVPYTFSFASMSRFSSTSRIALKYNYDGTSALTTIISQNTTGRVNTITFDSEPYLMMFFPSGDTYTDATFELQIEEGETATEYVAPAGMADYVARKAIDSVKSSIANVEPDSVVEENHPEGDVFFVGDTLVKATEAIPAGEDATGKIEPVAVKEYVDAGLADLDERKVNPNGYYEELVSGAAEQLIATQNVADSEPYFYRPAGGGADVEDREYLDAIVGGSVYWNQLLENGNFESASGWSSAISNGPISITVANNELTATFTGDSSSFVAIKHAAPAAKLGHVYLFSYEAKSDTIESIRYLTPANNAVSGPANIGPIYTRIATIIQAVTEGTQIQPIRKNISDPKPVDERVTIRNVMWFDLTQMFGSTVANYIYSLEQANVGAGVGYFRRWFPASYYPYNVGEMINVTGLTAHNTVGFNLWDEVWESGAYDTTTGARASNANNIRSVNPTKVIPGVRYCMTKPSGNQTYVLFYAEDGTCIKYVKAEGDTAAVYNMAAVLTSGKTFATFTVPEGVSKIQLRIDSMTMYQNDVCINFSHSGTRNGEYQPHVEHSYPLDSSVTLYGVMRIGADGKPYYDGDTYEPDGTVTRRWKVVDPQVLSWSYSGSSERFNATIRNEGITKTLGANSVVHWSDLVLAGPNQFYYQAANTGTIRVYLGTNPDVTPESDIKSFFPAGSVILVKLVNPVIEHAAPYNRVQVIDDYGSEEFVSTGILPPGHNTQYLANLRDKVQHLPSPASSNGQYVITQTDGQMSLAPVTDAKELPDIPGTDGTYLLKAAVSNGQLTLSWESAT